jgi:hypothetical protein
MRRDLVWETVQERAADPHASFGGMGVCSLLISVPRFRAKCLVNGPACVLEFAAMVIGAITGAINHPRCRLCAFPVHHRNQSGDASGEAMAFLLAHI